LRSAQYDLAAETYDEIIESGKNVGSNVEDLMKLSKSLNDFANGNYGGALDELLEQAETYPELYMYIGTCYAVTKDEDKMFESYEKYVTAYGFNSYVYAMYSSYYLEQDDLQTAIAYINNGLSCDDTVYRKELLMLEVTYYEKSGDFHEAYEKTVSLLSEYPDYETAQNELKFLETRDTDN
jgi:tetratricopeptide (TPR) repeat protein